MDAGRLDLQLRGRMADYVAETASLEDFEDWLLGNTWGTEVPGLRELVAQIELHIAEHTGGYIDEEELRERLFAFVSEYTVPSPDPRRQWAASDVMELVT